MKILFWGTPTYAVPTLSALHQAGHTIVGVVTQPDRRRGRGKQLMASPVKAMANQLLVPVFTPERIRHEEECKEALAGLGADVSVVVAFGQILPKEVLDQPPLGCWNGHGSLLPRWRGAGPIQWSILEGDQETGVGVMAMEEGLDTGPVLIEQRTPIHLLDNAEQLAQRLSEITAELMVKAMPMINAAGPASQKKERWQRLQLTDQKDINESITYARMLKKEDYELDWNESALNIHRRIMALYPNTYTKWNGMRLKIQESEPLIERLRPNLSKQAQNLLGRWPSGTTPSGQIIACEKDLGLVVSTNGCPLLIRAAQLQGKAKSDANMLLQQMAAKPGDQFQEC